MFYLKVTAIWFATIGLFSVFAVDSIIFPFYVVLSMFGILMLFIEYKITRCPKPSCRKGFAMYEVNRTLIDIRESTKKERRKAYNPYTQCDDYYYVDVPASKVLYEITERCSHCGYERTYRKWIKE